MVSLTDFYIIRTSLCHSWRIHKFENRYGLLKTIMIYFYGSEIKWIYSLTANQSWSSTQEAEEVPLLRVRCFFHLRIVGENIMVIL